MKKTFSSTLVALIAVAFTFAGIRIAQVIVAYWNGDTLQFWSFALATVIGVFLFDVYYRLKNGKPE